MWNKVENTEKGAGEMNKGPATHKYQVVMSKGKKDLQKKMHWPRNFLNYFDQDYQGSLAASFLVQKCSTGKRWLISAAEYAAMPTRLTGGYILVAFRDNKRGPFVRRAISFAHAVPYRYFRFFSSFTAPLFILFYFVSFFATLCLALKYCNKLPLEFTGYQFQCT